MLDAYDTTSFASMLRVELDKELAYLASEKVPLPEIVTSGIHTSEQEDWIDQLVLGAAHHSSCPILPHPAQSCPRSSAQPSPAQT